MLARIAPRQRRLLKGAFSLRWRFRSEFIVRCDHPIQALTAMKPRYAPPPGMTHEGGARPPTTTHKMKSDWLTVLAATFSR